MTSAVDAKSHSKGWLFCVLACLALVACDRQSAPVKLAGGTMGTSWHVSYLPGPEGGPSPAAVERELEALLEQVNQSMSTYREDSEILRVNRAPTADWVPLSPAFFEVLTVALEIGRASEGAYDVSVAPLVDLWGFGPGQPRQAPPAEKDIRDVRERVGQHYLELDPQLRALRKRRALELDFSSIAKGYAVDVLASFLESQQIADYLVEVGGEMRVAGHSPRGDKWRIAIEQPDAGAPGIARAIALNKAAVATSGDYRNYFEVDGVRYSHSIDPRTGYPVTHDLVSVTVVAESAMAADAWATALIVLGAGAADEVARQHQLAVYFIRREGERFVASHTPAFGPYLEAGDAAQQGEEAREARQ